MRSTPRLWSAVLPRVSASLSDPLATGKTATHALNRNATSSISAHQRTVTTSGARMAAASPTPVKTALTDKSKTPYSNYTSTPISAKPRTMKKAINVERVVTATPTSKTSDDVSDSTFPVPQPAAALPDYAALAPPLNPPPSSAMPPHSIHLVEAPGFGDSAESLHAQNDWSTSFHGLSSKPFDKEVAQILMRPLDIKDIEIKPDGLLYLPEIKYRRTLNEAFGPGGWGMAPRGETTIGQRIISREWGLVCLGRLVSVARGEQEYFSVDGIPTAIEASKSNAVLRCCKDLGIASELWDPTFIREFKKKYCTEVMVEHITQKKKRKLWRKKEDKFDYPYKEL